MENPAHFTNPGATPSPDTMAAVQLLDLFRDPDRDIDRIVEFISHDPALTAETLRRCNSAQLQGAQPTTDIFEAVSRLGFYELYGLVAAAIGSHTPFSDAQANSELEMLPADNFFGAARPRATGQLRV